VIKLMTADQQFAPDFTDEIVSAMCVTHAGEVVHQQTRTLLTETGGTIGE
jgi:NAD(P) transhydrogenase subunit alpha